MPHRFTLEEGKAFIATLPFVEGWTWCLLHYSEGLYIVSCVCVKK